MKLIRDLMPADKLNRQIEEVIKLDQQEEGTVRHEIEEYIATERIKKDYEQFLRDYSDGLSNPDERVGVWISGFFGSGKSSFAKNLGYVLQNRDLVGTSASELFIDRLKDDGDTARVQKLAETIRFINARIPTRVIMFDVRLIASSPKGDELIHQLMYSKLLSNLDYADDLDIAELEIELEQEQNGQRFAEFVRACARLFREEVRGTTGYHPVPVTLPGVSQADYDVWVMVRKGAQAFQRIMAVLREVSSSIAIADDTGASLRNRARLNIDVLVDRTFELASRRVPGQAVAFIMDEVGSYVALSVNKIEDLRKVVEHFGQEGANRVRARKAVAPVWVVVTSQEKLDEVVQAIDDKRVELARLQDRFALKIDMSPSDIREVASSRVLSKTKQGAAHLKTVYDQYVAQLKTHTRLQVQGTTPETSRDDFVQYYPYLPHFLDLSIQIVSGLRSQSGAFKQLGGSNRTIIKQAHEMLVRENTGMQDLPIGELVTLDRIYDLVEGNLSSEKRADISTIERRWGDEPWVLRTAKAIALLEYVRGTPRTAENIAALLYRTLGNDSPLSDVQTALEVLSLNEFIRQTETGWKLLSLQEKSWSTKRNSFTPTPRDQNTILEEQLRTIFQDKSLARYRYKDIRTFQVDVRWSERVIIDGKEQIPLVMIVTDDQAELTEQVNTLTPETRDSRHASWDRIFWLFSLNEDIRDIMRELYRSRRMVSEYEGMRAQGNLNVDDTKSLAEEKTLAIRSEERLRTLVTQVLESGESLFRGVHKESASWGTRLSTIMSALFQHTVPQLYPKLDIGARQLPKKGQEAEEILKAANLQGLSSTIFYSAPDALDLVRKDEKSSKWVVNLEAPIVREIKTYLDSEHAYGNKVTGKSIEAKFGGLGYGWEPEVLWLVLATLLRGGAIEVTYQGRRYRNHLDPQVRAPFMGANAFRSASFAPRKAPDLQTLVGAARRFEELTGDEVDIEESAIAQAFQTLARKDLENLLSLEAVIKANQVDVVRDEVEEYRSTLETILNSASDDVVNIMTGEWQTFRMLRERIHVIWSALNDEGLKHLTRVRTAVRRIVPMLKDENLSEDTRRAIELLEHAVASKDYFDPDQRNLIDTALQLVETAYSDAFIVRHTNRRHAVQQAIEEIKNIPALRQALSQIDRDNLTEQEYLEQKTTLEKELLRPLVAKGALDTSVGENVTFSDTNPTLSQMASDIASVERIKSDIMIDIQKLAAPQEKIEQVKLSSLAGFGHTLSTETDVENLVNRIREHLLNLVQSGTKVIVE